MERYDCSGYVTRNDLLCSDGRIIRKDAFKHNDGKTVPVVYMHNHTDPNNILGHALLENRADGVYGYITFNDSESGAAIKEAVRHGDVKSLSIFANKLKQSGGDVLHGFIREVSVVMAGANPGAYIDTVMAHGEDTEEGLIINYDENIMIHHYTEVEPAPASEPEPEVDESLSHADEKEEDKKDMADEKKPEEKKTEEKVKEKKTEEKTVKDVYNTFTEEQKTVVYALIDLALEDAGVSDDEEEDDEDKNAKHSEGEDNTMKHNIFDNDETVQTNFLSHADQMAILDMAKNTTGSFKKAMEQYAADHQNSLAHGIEDIDQLFPDFKDVHPGAPELLERDHSWVGQVMNKAHKSPVSRVRTRQLDARAKELRAKGYNNREEEKALSGNLKLLMRTTDPQTVYYRDSLHRDDIVDITDFDVVAYQRNVMKRALEEEIALAALIGDGRDDVDTDKISEDHIRPIWTDDDLYTIKASIDIAAAKSELQGSNTGANFGENYVYAEAVVTAALYARENYKGKGALDFYCTPHLLNVMLLARDLNGRRIYDTKEDLAKVLNVANIYTVEQFADRTREDADGNEHKLLGLFVNMGNYQFGCTKGGEVTSFEDFDIDFNAYKYLIETRLSGALTEVYSAIALEEPVVAG